MTQPDALVIGGGIAGLRAAVELAARGARVRLLEAKAILGGRASSFNDPQTGERVDNGQHVLLGCYRETFAFLDRIGARDRVRMQPALEVEFVDRLGVHSRLRCPALPAPLNLLAGLFDWSALGWADRIAALRIGSVPPASDGETVAQWLALNGQTTRLREMLWEPLAVAALNQPIDEAAAPPFVRVLREMLSGDAQSAALGLPAVPLDELFAEPARRYIEDRGGEVRVGSPAKIVLAGDRLDRVESRGETFQSKAVICAVAWHALPEALAGDTAIVDSIVRDARATAASPIVSVNLWFDRPVLQTPFVGLPGRTMQWVFDKGQLFEPGATSHVTLVSSGAESVIAQSNDSLIAVALHELRDAFPESRAARVMRAAVVKERRATFSLAPGQPKRPSVRTGVSGLVLAGDWIDTGMPATIEGAALSGRLAAEALS